MGDLCSSCGAPVLGGAESCDACEQPVTEQSGIGVGTRVHITDPLHPWHDCAGAVISAFPYEGMDWNIRLDGGSGECAATEKQLRLIERSGCEHGQSLGFRCELCEAEQSAIRPGKPAGLIGRGKVWTDATAAQGFDFAEAELLVSADGDEIDVALPSTTGVQEQMLVSVPKGLLLAVLLAPECW